MQNRAFYIVCIGLCAGIAICLGAIIWMLLHFPAAEPLHYESAHLVMGGMFRAAI